MTTSKTDDKQYDGILDIAKDILSLFNTKSKVHVDNVQKPLKPDSSDHDHADNTTCSFGQAQSPINIMNPGGNKDKDAKTIIMNEQDFHTNALKILYPSSVKNCTILNNGHTVQINIAPENKCILVVNNKNYLLKQFHFHTPSEHLIDSKQYEMEMHLVHLDSDNNIAVLGLIFTTTQKHIKPLLKLSQSRMHLTLDVGSKSKKKSVNTLDVMHENDPSDDLGTDDDYQSDDDLGTDDDYESDNDKKQVDAVAKKKKVDNSKNNDNELGNDFLDQFWDQLPENKTTSDILLKKALSFDYLFETSSSNFVKDVKTNEINVNMELFEYMGSLTTPPYTEGVQWLVSKKTHFINQKQVNKLSACWGNKSNARKVQKYFGRVVSLRSQVSLKGV